MIRSKGRNDRFYLVVPMPLAAAIELKAGELVQWTLTQRDILQVKRFQGPTSTPVKKPSRRKPSRK